MKTAVSVSSLAFYGYDLSTVITETAALGFRYLEPALIASYNPAMTERYFSPRRAAGLLSQLAHAGLEAVTLAAHIDSGRPQSYAMLKRRLEFAASLGAKILITNATTTDNTSRFYRTLERLIPAAEQLGVIIALENPGDGHDSLLDTGEGGMTLCREFSSPFLRLNYDVCNTFSYSRGKLTMSELALDLEKAMPFVSHLHLKNMMKVQSGWQFCALDRGVIDYAGLLEKVINGGECPPMSIELPLSFARKPDFTLNVLPPDRRPTTDRIREIVSASYRYLLTLTTINAAQSGQTSRPSPFGGHLER